MLKRRGHRVVMAETGREAVDAWRREASDRQRCLESGMDAYLTKPVQAEALDRLLQQVGRQSEWNSPVSLAAYGAGNNPVNHCSNRASRLSSGAVQTGVSGGADTAPFTGRAGSGERPASQIASGPWLPTST